MGTLHSSGPQIKHPEVLPYKAWRSRMPLISDVEQALNQALLTNRNIPSRLLVVIGTHNWY